MLVGTYVYVVDNTGAIEAKCIKILGSSYCNSANIGDRVIVTIKKVLFGKQVKLKSIHKAIVIHQKKKNFRKNGGYLSFIYNRVVLLKNKTDPLGTRIYGCAVQELRYKKGLKIILLAWNLI